jgi:hypothetical protein
LARCAATRATNSTTKPSGTTVSASPVFDERDTRHSDVRRGDTKRAFGSPAGPWQAPHHSDGHDGARERRPPSGTLTLPELVEGGVGSELAAMSYPPRGSAR